jgi:tRNA dimethylallyltransferase
MHVASNMGELVVIFGPTACGKSARAVEIALERGGEVISADSRQIYRGLNIGTGKITQEEMRGVPHH